MDDESSAMQERSPQLEGGGIEGDGCKLKEDFRGGEVEVRGLKDEAQDVAVRDKSALGAARRA
jgi:hypothetical protein